MAGHIEISEIYQKEEEKNEIKTNINNADNADKTSYDEEEDVQQTSFYSNVKRYSRYDLLSLRSGQLSIHYPQCALRTDLQTLSVWTCRLRCELQYLGLWKIPNTGNPYHNCSCNGSCQSYACGDTQPYLSTASQVNAANSQMCYGTVQQPQQVQPVQQTTNASPTLGSKRAVRSRERSLNYQRCINTELIRATSPSNIDGSIQQHLKPAFIDHRSISSSHLMPAFAKRRMGHANAVHGQSADANCSNFNNNCRHNSEHLTNDDAASESSTHFEASLKSRKDSAKTASNQNDYHIYKSSANNRVDKSGGDQSLESQSGWMNLIKKVNSEYTASNNKAGNAGSVNKKLIYERRIGSGRLVPREVNWDMRTGNSKQIEKENSTIYANVSSNNNSEKEKDTNIFGDIDKLNNRNSSIARYSDGRAQDRRMFDRRITNTDDAKNAVSSSGSSGGSNTNKRYTATSVGEERNNIDANYHQQQQQHFSGQRSMSFRRREYVEHKDHHRDFRDFRDAKDSRENREHKEHRGGGGDHHHNHHHRDRKEEPEWFSEGPTSQHDTIELRGFEETDESQQQQPEPDICQYNNSIIERKTSECSLLSHNSSSNANLSTKENFDISTEVTHNSHNNTNTFDKDIDSGSSCNTVNETAIPLNKDDAHESPTDTTQILAKPEELENADKRRTNVTELFFDNFLNIEALENTLIGSGNDQSMPSNNDVSGTSRFSRWFFNNSNNLNSNEFNNNPPTKDDSKLLNKDLNESDFNSFMTFLKCNKFPTPDLPKGLPSNVSPLSVEELESRMRKMDSGEIEKNKSCNVSQSLEKSDGSQTKATTEFESEADPSPQSAEINSQDVEAFRKLLDQLGKPRVDISMNIILPNTPGQAHSSLATSVGGYHTTGISPIPHNNTLAQTNVAKQEYMMKLMHQQQQQQQMLHHQQNAGKMVAPILRHHHHHRIPQMSPQQQQQTENLPLMSAPPQHHPHSHYMPIIMGPSQKRLDVQHLIQSVVREELSRSFLEKELKNPNVPPYTKDIISTVLKETSRYHPPAAGGQNATDAVEAAATATDISAAPNHLMQSLARGEVSLNLLEHELNKLNNLSTETPNNEAFKERSRCGTPLATSLNVVSIPTSGALIVPLPQVVPAQKQNSALANENVCTISTDQQHAISSMLRSHHEDSALHMPTQRELQMHTQAIMQNALFKKKIDVDESMRRRQEMHKQQEMESSSCFSQQHQQQTLNSNSVMSQQGHHQQTSRHVNSPTPLAFTPTSVLRKMTAEKDTISNATQATTLTSSSPQQMPAHVQQQHLKIPTHPQIHGQQITYQHSNQPRMILGGGNFQYMHQQHQIAPAANGSPQISPQQKTQIRNQPPLKWSLIPHSSAESNHALLNTMSNKPMGRPILKGPGPIQPLVPQNTHNPLAQNQPNVNNQSSQMQNYPSIQHPRQIVGQQFPAHIIQQIPATTQQNNMQQQLFQQRSVVMQRQQIQQNDLGNHAPLPPSAAHHPACNDTNSVTNLNFQREGGLSPTSNQLAQWFSPELLAQASAGKLPLLNMNQALSLEEFERSIQHSSTSVNN